MLLSVDEIVFQLLVSCFAGGEFIILLPLPL